MKEIDTEMENEKQTEAAARNSSGEEPLVALEPGSIAPEQLAELKERAGKADEHWDRLLRTTADFDNFKKRAAREKQDAIKFANESLLQKLIPVLDNFDMALAATQTSGKGDAVQSLQTGVNIGNLCAALASLILLSWLKFDDRVVFLVGILPALLVLWIRHAVPEPEEWKTAKQNAAEEQPRFVHLFQGPVRRITLTVILVCATALSGHWAFMFWFPQQLRRLPDVQTWTDTQRNGLASTGLALVMIMSIIGNFLAGYLARLFGYRRAVSFMCLAYFISMMATYSAGLMMRLTPLRA